MYYLMVSVDLEVNFSSLEDVVENFGRGITVNWIIINYTATQVHQLTSQLNSVTVISD